MSTPQITLTARHSTSAADARRGVARLHPEVLDALGLHAWDAVQLTGSRATAVLAAAGETGSPPGTALLDDVTLSNAGLTEGAEVVVSPVEVAPARSITLAGSTMASRSVPAETLRLALMGKVLTTGDAVSLLPMDLTPGSDTAAVRAKLATAIGMTWTNELLTVTATDPPGTVAPQPSTVATWRDGPSTGRTGESAASWAGESAAGRPGSTAPAVGSAAPAVGSVPAPQPESLTAPPVSDLVGAQTAAKRLTEWLELTFQQPDLLTKLGSSSRLGVAITGPAGVGKSTLVRSVAQAVGAAVVEVSGPSLVAIEAASASNQVRDAVAEARASAEQGTPCLLLISDADELLPASNPPPLATVVLDMLRVVMDTPQLALVVTSAHPESLDPRLRSPDLVDRDVAIPLPDTAMRTELLRVLLREVPLGAGVDLGAVAERTPGFVAADLVALRREAAVRAALRHRDAEPDALTVEAEDLFGALDTVRPISMSATDTVATGGLTLDAVGDMAETKQSLTEAVLWPLRYPDSFVRLGVEPPRGVLLYGPPGCGKTFLLRALAGTGALNVFTVKGAELLDKWVGESERAVRELFRRAADAAPSLLFLDEVDALAPRRGQSGDSGVSDRVVAALLTELDGVEPLREVVVVGATNRPELIDPALLRPGRLERLVYVPPPADDARAEILRSAARNTPLAGDVDLDALAAELEGYSAADCAALIREAALTAMRESLEAVEVTGAHLAAARDLVRPSLDPAQVASLVAFAEQQRPS